MKINTSEIKWHVIFIILVLMLVYPLLFSLSTSFKTMSEAFTSSSLIPQAPTLSAYERKYLRPFALHRSCLIRLLLRVW